MSKEQRLHEVKELGQHSQLRPQSLDLIQRSSTSSQANSENFPHQNDREEAFFINLRQDYEYPHSRFASLKQENFESFRKNSGSRFVENSASHYSGHPKNGYWRTRKDKGNAGEKQSDVQGSQLNGNHSNDHFWPIELLVDYSVGKAGENAITPIEIAKKKAKNISRNYYEQYPQKISGCQEKVSWVSNYSGDNNKRKNLSNNVQLSSEKLAKSLEDGLNTHSCKLTDVQQNLRNLKVRPAESTAEANFPWLQQPKLVRVEPVIHSIPIVKQQHTAPAFRRPTLPETQAAADVFINPVYEITERSGPLYGSAAVMQHSVYPDNSRHSKKRFRRFM